MKSFFDSPPTTQSRLLTFRCPNHGKSPDKKCFITIAWKAKDPKYGKEVSLVAENVPYYGKPLALLPSAIENNESETFPLGTLYATCSCLPKRKGKVCYLITEVTDTPQSMSEESGKKSTFKMANKISQDINASTQLLVQIYDGLESLQEAFIRHKKRTERKLQETTAKVENLERILRQSQSNQMDILETIESYMRRLGKETHSLIESIGEQEESEDGKRRSFPSAGDRQIEVVKEESLAEEPLAKEEPLLEDTEPIPTFQKLAPRLQFSQDNAKKQSKVAAPPTEPLDEEDDDSDDSSMDSSFAAMLEEEGLFDEEDEKQEEGQEDSFAPENYMSVTKIMEASIFKSTIDSALQSLDEKNPNPPKKRGVTKIVEAPVYKGRSRKAEEQEATAQQQNSDKNPAVGEKPSSPTPPVEEKSKTEETGVEKQNKPQSHREHRELE